MNNKLIILDLDETLFYCDILPLDNYGYKFPLDDNRTYYAIKRPYVDEFITYIKENYEYGVYTAASKDYALEHCKNLNLDPKFLLHQDNCTVKTDYETYNQYYLKKLSKLKKYASLSDMIAIDDRFESYANNYGNLVRVEPFYFNQEDDVLLKLIDYLEILRNAIDVRKVDKRGWYV